MSKLKHTRKGQGITIENNISKKKETAFKLCAPPRGRTETEKKSKLYWKQ